MSEEPLTLDELFDQLGNDFKQGYIADPQAAWMALMLGVMTNLKILANSQCVQNLRDLVSVAQVIEEKLGKGKTKTAEGETAFDAVGKLWRADGAVVGDGGSDKKVSTDGRGRRGKSVDDADRQPSTDLAATKKRSTG